MMDRAFKAILLFLVALLPLFVPPTYAASIPKPTAQTVDASPSALRARLLGDMGVPAWHTRGGAAKASRWRCWIPASAATSRLSARHCRTHVTVHSFRSDGNLEAKDSQHGILCGEVVHAIAPQAELLFANWDPEQPRAVSGGGPLGAAAGSADYHLFAHHANLERRRRRRRSA